MTAGQTTRQQTSTLMLPVRRYLARSSPNFGSGFGSSFFFSRGIGFFSVAGLSVGLVRSNAFSPGLPLLGYLVGSPDGLEILRVHALVAGQAERASGTEALFNEYEAVRLQDRAGLAFEIGEKDIIVD